MKKGIYGVLITAFIVAVLLVGSAAADTNMIRNGDFSTGTLSPWNVDTANGGVVSVVSDAGGYSAAMLTFSANSNVSRAGIYQTNVDLRNVSTLKFKMKWNTYEGDYYTGVHVGGVYINDHIVQDINTFYYTSSYYNNSVSIPSEYRVENAKVEIMFEVDGYMGESYSGQHTLEIFVTDITAMNPYYAPIVNSVGLSDTEINVANGTGVTAEVTFTPGYPTATTITYDWGNGFVDTVSDTSKTLIYTTPGVYTVRVKASNDYYESEWVTAGTVEVVNMAFTQFDTTGNVPLTATFNVNATTSSGVSFDFFVMHYGNGVDSGQSQDIQYQYQYTTAGIYTPYLTGYTSTGHTYTYTSPTPVNTNAQSVSWDETSYNSGDTATISWSIRSWDSSYTYKMQVFESDSIGTITGTAVREYTIPNSSTTSTTINTTGLTGNYTALIIQSGGTSPVQLAQSPVVSIVSIITLTVNISANDTIYTEPTTVSVLKDGQIFVYDGEPQTKTNITTGSTTFEIPSGIYDIRATTDEYAAVTGTIDTATARSIKIDFVKGASEGGTTPGGSGSAYASTFITFRIMDSGTGSYLQGVTVTANAVEATNPVDWVSQLFGGSWGSEISGTTLNGTTDREGRITFAMFPVYRYNLHLVYGDYENDYSFQPSTLTGEELIRLPITQWSQDSQTMVVTTIVETNDDKQIIVTYNDASGTTSALSVQLYQWVDGERVVVGNPVTATNPEANWTYTFSPTEPSGKEYIVQFKANVGVFYAQGADKTIPNITRDFSVAFNGPRIPLGNIPDAMYIVICFGILVMLGAVGTFITSRMYALVICVVAAFLWYAGWMFALGPAGGIALILCFVLAIVYYMATGGQPQ